MTKKVTLIRTVVHREIDGEQMRVHPTIGKVFDYTDKEIAEILKAKKNGLRDPQNEEDADLGELTSTAVAVDSGASASTDKKPAKGNARAAKGATGDDI